MRGGLRCGLHVSGNMIQCSVSERELDAFRHLKGEENERIREVEVDGQ